MVLNISMIIKNDWIKPLTRNLNKEQHLNLTEEYIISLIPNPEDKQLSKCKRTPKRPNNEYFKVRDYPNCIDLLKIPNSRYLYLLGKSLVVYVVAQAPSAMDSDECAHDSTSERMQEDECIHPGGIPNPESELGYMFDAKILAVGSLINNSFSYITDEDSATCEELGLSSMLAGKIIRADKVLSQRREPDAVSSSKSDMATEIESDAGMVGIRKRPPKDESAASNKRTCLQTS